MKSLRLHVIACPVFQRELELLAANVASELQFQHLDMGLHEGTGTDLRRALQDAIDAVPAGSCDFVVIAYGLCNRGVIGLQARAVPVVIPRAHDCIGMLLGNTRGYLAQLESKPGTYFQSAGWLENSPASGELRGQLTFGPNSNVTRAELTAKYGEENADYLLQQFAAFTQHYERLAFIATPVPEAARWEAAARRIAERQGWKFESLPGNLGWLQRLLSGEWTDPEFLVLQPGQRVGLRSDAQLIGADPS